MDELKKIYCFDIDGTICKTSGSKYELSVPITSRIKKINSLYDNGHTIFFLTARGMGRTDNNPQESYNVLYEFTRSQLTSWGIKYHKLFLGKPQSDIYIDDKGIHDGDFFNE
jgi:phosphatidate phosphatase PAH1